MLGFKSFDRIIHNLGTSALADGISVP